MEGEEVVNKAQQTLYYIRILRKSHLFTKLESFNRCFCGEHSKVLHNSPAFKLLSI